MVQSKNKLNATSRIKNKIIWFFLFLINLPILILIIIINPFIKIRINELETRSIGHFSISTEIFLAEIKNNIYKNERTIFLWFINKKISNKYLLKKWKENIFLGPRIILKPLFLMILKLNFLKFLRSPFRHWLEIKNKNKWQLRDKYNLLRKTKPFIKLNDQENYSFNGLLKKFNLKKNEYICFFARSHHYLNQPIALRDANINNQALALSKICKKYKYKAVRMGGKNQSKIKQKNPLIIDYAKSMRKNDMFDILLPMNCKFMIGTDSGISYIPILNRKKILIVDHTAMHDIEYLPDDYVSLIIPKKFKRISDNKILNYSKVFELGLNKIYYEKDLRSMGYKTILNSKKEVYLAVEEMNNLVDLKKTQTEDSTLQKIFWRAVYKYYKVKPPRFVKVSNSFLSLNKKIIN